MTISCYEIRIAFTRKKQHKKNKTPCIFHHISLSVSKIEFNIDGDEVFLKKYSQSPLKAILIIFKSFTRTARRFPLPMLAAALSFVFLMIEMHFGRIGTEVVHDYRYVKLSLECMSAISLYIAFDIFSESHQLARSARGGLYLLGFCILGMHYFSITPGMFDSETIFISRYLIFLVCFHLMVSFLAFSRSIQTQAFWHYNYALLKRFIITLLYSLTLFIGLASALFALDKLFNFQINTDYFIDLCAFIFLIFNTLFFLNGIPEDYNEFNKSIDFNKSIRIFVQFVLLPIVGIYISILYIYMVKIIVNQQLPNGWVCIPILIFSIIGVLAYLLIYPIRLNQSNRLIYMYAKYFFYILLPLLSLFFIAIIKRIMPYGITEDRYLVFMLGSWIVIISIYILISKIDNIIIIPLSLFILLSVSAVGPWGMFQLSVANQVMRLEHLLKRNHLLENGKLVKLGSQYTVSKKDAASIRSIFSYLNKRGEINAIHRWLDEKDQVKLDSAIAQNDLVYIHSIFSDLGPDENTPYELHHFFVAPDNTMQNSLLSIEGYKHISQFNCAINDFKQKEIFNSLSIFASLKNDSLQFRVRKDSLFSIPLSEKFNTLIQYVLKTDSLKATTINASNTLRVINTASQTCIIPADSMILFSNGKKIIFNTIEFVQLDSVYHIQRVQGLLLD